MEIKGDSIVDSIVEYANIKFGVELSIENVSAQLKELSLGKTLQVVDAIKHDNTEEFLEYIDITVDEAYGTAGTHAPSNATNRRYNTTQDQMARQQKLASVQRGGGGERTVAGGAKVPTGTRAPVDPDDAERQANSASTQNNAAEIDRLRDLVMKVARSK